MVEKIAYELRKEQKLTSCVTVKIRYSNFDTHTLQKRIPYTSFDHKLMETAKELFKDFTNGACLSGSSVSGSATWCKAPRNLTCLKTRPKWYISTRPLTGCAAVWKNGGDTGGGNGRKGNR